MLGLGFRQLPLTSLIPSAPERELQPLMTHFVPLSVPEHRE